MKNPLSSQRPMIISGLVYGLGLLLGNIISYVIFQVFPSEAFLTGGQGINLLIGILIAFLISGIGGLIGGCLGGWTLPTIGQGKGRWGYIWRSGITFGVGYGLLIFPVILVVGLLSFYDASSTPPIMFGIIFGIIGVIFGILMGVSLGLWTAGRRFPPITRSSALGFGLGGIFLGFGLWKHLVSMTDGDIASGEYFWFILGLLFFGGFGGASLGFVYQRLAVGDGKSLLPIRAMTRKSWQRRWVIIGIVVLLVALIIRPVIAAVGDMLTPFDAQLSPVLELPTTGTHWFDATVVTTTPNLNAQPAISANKKGSLALTWVEEDKLYLQRGDWSATTQETIWQAPQVVVEGTKALAGPQVAVDGNGRNHLAWSTNGEIFTSQCENETCSAPQVISSGSVCEGLVAGDNRVPTIAATTVTVMLVWENGSGKLPYATWAADDMPPATAVACVSDIAEALDPRLAAGVNDTFVLIGTNSVNEILVKGFDNEAWNMAAEVLGNGRFPEIFADQSGQRHAAWCSDEGLIYYHNGQNETVSDMVCHNRPAVALDEMGQAHVVWYGDQTLNSNGVSQPNTILYESVRTADGWTLPTIVGQALEMAQPSLSAVNDGSLHLTWHTPNQIAYTAQVQYSCDPDNLSIYSRAMFDIARQEKYQPPDDIVPFCQNRYDRLLISPNPDPAFSNEPVRENGVFDSLGDLIRAAEYEVLYSTMWYDTPTNNDSPGSVIAAAVADLYANVKAHPEQYPRGMTVRIMLGNPPELAMGETTGQLWTLIGDLRQAGIDKMVDEELGWRLEVADFEGNMPHSHVKTTIIDGKIAAANGFNMTYNHFPKEHPSGKGNGRFDLGLQVTGPVVQASQRMFDDMWAGADERTCLNLNPPLGIPWQVTCYDVTAVADHVPEVQKFYLPGDDSVAFSMYRSKVHDLADQQTIAVLSMAQDSLDLIHVNFTLETICNLNILFNVCEIDNSPDYMPAILQAAENGANVRILVKPSPFEGIENNVALDAIHKRIAELSLEDNVEIRFFSGPVHAKAALIDEELLIIGSQNFHYSAFGTGGGLTEYSLAVEDPQAVSDQQKLFNYYWDQAEPAN